MGEVKSGKSIVEMEEFKGNKNTFAVVVFVKRGLCSTVFWQEVWLMLL